MMATGDEQGVIKIWDNRKAEAVMVYTEHEDFIADMTFSPEHNTLVAVGGDGYLSTWDIRKPDVAAMSDHMEDELLSIALLKNGKKAVVGSQEGILSLWTWGDWGDYSDRMVGHPSSIDAICKLDEDTICTGSSDGLIRIVSILPNEFHGIIGDHGEDMPIEHIRLTHDKKYMLSSGHDETLRFWDVGHLFAEGGDEEEDQHDEEEEEEEEEDAMEAAGSGTGPGSGPKDAGSDFGDSASDDSDDSDEEKISKKRRKKQQKKQVQQKRPNKKNTSFFSDL
ncbi:WD domain repeat-containing protein 55 [Apophysomyces ossiformis]|uniref:WD repeat-containing protein JIP5 n=1 Tax=Apophysomyces ossiformis TaxID=679940 RepID=A0A8H7BR97_9FUNG|nr:WD domain repeat-containing protein 55 [Apophysomyces ossiformis]